MSNTDILAFVSQGIGYQFYIEVVETFTHRFTKETIRRIRVDHVNRDGKAATNFYTVNEKEFQSILNRRVEE